LLADSTIEPEDYAKLVHPIVTDEHAQRRGDPAGRRDLDGAEVQVVGSDDAVARTPPNVTTGSCRRISSCTADLDAAAQHHDAFVGAAAIAAQVTAPTPGA
jgi:hypothetical protein